MSFFQTLLYWSEVWALLIPLSIILLYRPQGMKTGWLVMYVMFALLLNTASTVMGQFYGIMPSWLKNNNILYNIHSFIRVLFFGFYIMTVRRYKFPVVIKVLLASYVIFIIINFSFIEPLLFLSPNLYAAESIVLLIICLIYYFRSIQDEGETYWLKQPSFLVCTGISLYEVITFFVFLFFNIINYSTEHQDQSFASVTLIIYQISFIILCILLAAALYRNRRRPAASAH